MRRLDTGSLFSIKCATCTFLVFIWAVTIDNLVRHNPRAALFCYILLAVTIFELWWLLGFKQVTLSGHSLIVRDSRREAHIPVELVKRVVEHPVSIGLAYVTIIFNADTQFGRRVRVPTSWSDCKQMGSLIRRAMEKRK